MAKQSGLGDNFYLDGWNLSGDVGSLGAIAGGPSAREITGIDKSGFERKGGNLTGRMEWSSWFNPTNAHLELSTLETTSKIASYLRGTGIGNEAACVQAKQVNYDPDRSAEGDLTIAVQVLTSDAFPLEWGIQLTAGIHTSSAAENLTSYDYGADAPDFYDAQAYLHVFSFTGTDATISIETSDDDGAIDPFNARITFDQITAAPVSDRKTQTSPGTQLMERYARVAVSTTGGFTDLQFAVVLVRNETAVNY